MKNVGVYVTGTGAVASPESISVSVEAIVAVLNAGFDGHHSAKTIQLALETLKSAVSAATPGTEGVTISGSTITQPTYNDFIEDELPDDEEGDPFA